jgi:hypothetical protein
VRQWSDDVVFFAHKLELGFDSLDQLQARGVQVVDGEVARIVVDGDALSGVELVDGRVIPRTAVFVRPVNVPHADGLLAALAVRSTQLAFRRSMHGPNDHSRSLGGRQCRRSPLPGHHLSRRGSAAAIAINADLVRDDVEHALRTRSPVVDDGADPERPHG